MDNYKLDDDDDLIYFNTSVYLDDILQSYHYDENHIIDQIKQDLPRIDVYWEDKKINTYKDFIECSNKYKYTGVYIKDKLFHLQNIIAMLINQSSYYLQYKTLHNTFCTGINTDKIVLCCSDNRYIKYTIEDNELVVSICARFIVTDMYKRYKYREYNTSIIIHLDNNNFKKYGMFMYSLIN